MRCTTGAGASSGASTSGQATDGTASGVAQVVPAGGAVLTTLSLTGVLAWLVLA